MRLGLGVYWFWRVGDAKINFQTFGQSHAAGVRLLLPTTCFYIPLVPLCLKVGLNFVREIESRTPIFSCASEPRASFEALILGGGGGGGGEEGAYTIEGIGTLRTLNSLTAQQC